MHHSVSLYYKIFMLSCDFFVNGTFSLISQLSAVLLKQRSTSIPTMELYLFKDFYESAQHTLIDQPECQMHAYAAGLLTV